MDKEQYREEIIEMVKELENENFIMKIYHYILAKYRREKAGD